MIIISTYEGRVYQFLILLYGTTNLINVRIAFDGTKGRGALPGMPAVTAVEVIRSVRHPRKLHRGRVVPAAGAAVTSSRINLAHVVDYSVHEYPERQHQHISSWMTANLLTLNSSKTEFLLIGVKNQLAGSCSRSRDMFGAHRNLYG